MQDYGDMIREAREARGWTQEELAAQSGVPKRTIQEIENGRVRKPQRANDLKLRQTLDLAGDPEQGRADLPPGVQRMADIVGAYLAALPEDEAVQWFADFLRRDVGAG